MEMRNYHSLMAIVAAINTVYVCRVIESEKALSSKAKTLKTQIESFMSSENNFATYRETLKKLFNNGNSEVNSNSVVIPYLGLLMKDIFVILSDDYKYDTTSHLFNFSKLNVLLQIVVMFQSFRRAKCELVPDVQIRPFITNLFTLSENEMDVLTSASNLQSKIV